MLIVTFVVVWKLEVFFLLFVQDRRSALHVILQEVIGPACVSQFYLSFFLKQSDKGWPQGTINGRWFFQFS